MKNNTFVVFRSMRKEKDFCPAARLPAATLIKHSKPKSKSQEKSAAHAFFEPVELFHGVVDQRGGGVPADDDGHAGDPCNCD